MTTAPAVLRPFRPSKATLAMALVVAAAAGLRFFRLGAASLWYDEVITAHTAAQKLTFHFLWLAQNVNDIPVYLMFMHYWVHAVGASEWALRLPSVLFGLLSVCAMYRAGKAMFGAETGVIAAFFMAVSPFHVHFAQSARAYPFFTFFSLLSFYYFVRVLEKPSAGRSAAYVAWTTLLVYVHQYAVFLVVAQNAHFIVEKALREPRARLGWARWAALQGVVALLFLPWVVFQLGVVSRLKSEGFWIPKMDSLSVYQTFLYFAGSPALLCAFVLLIFAPLFGGPDAGLADKARMRRLAALWMAAPIFIAWIFSVKVFPIYVSRYILPCSLPFYLLAADGVKALGNRWLKAAVVALVALLSFASVRAYYAAGDLDAGPEQHAEEWREAVARIDKLAKPADAMLFHTFTAKWAFEYYTKHKEIAELHALPEAMGLYVTDRELGVVDTVAATHPRVWLVYAHPRDAQRKLQKRLERTHRMTHYFILKGAFVLLYEKSPAGGPR